MFYVFHLAIYGGSNNLGLIMENKNKPRIVQVPAGIAPMLLTTLEIANAALLSVGARPVSARDVVEVFCPSANAREARTH